METAVAGPEVAVMVVVKEVAAKEVAMAAVVMVEEATALQ
mgnify:CR=1 FL=1